MSNPQDRPQSVEIFFAYSRVDEKLRNKLENHLSILKRQKLIKSWHDRQISSGMEWAGQIDQHLNTANIILLLISDDFLASEYCYDIEMVRALERHEAGEARVIPIILRPVAWKESPFGKLQALPKDAKAVTTWANRDKAFADIAEGIRRVIGQLVGHPISSQLLVKQELLSDSKQDEGLRTPVVRSTDAGDSASLQLMSKQILPINLKQRVAVVTAAGSGIGRAAVRQFLAQDMIVVAVDSYEPALVDLARIRQPTNLFTLLGDMTNLGDVERVFSQVAPMGRLDVLVNGVGSLGHSSLRTLGFDQWQRMFDSNLTSVFACTRAALPLFEASDGDSVIINISSALAHNADPDTSAYGAFKAALEQWTRCIALDLAPSGIRAVAVAPGPVAWSNEEAAWETERYAALNPLGRFATPDEIAGVIAFLTSPAATYITGVTISVDGGDSALGVGWGTFDRLRLNLE